MSRVDFFQNLKRNKISPLSVGDAKFSDESDEERLILEETDNMEGYWGMSPSHSSTGKQVSTIASRQLTKSSALSAVQLDYKINTR